MSITDELREWWVRKFPVMDKELHKDFTAIADRIDAVHERAMADAYLSGTPTDEKLTELGWIRMPKDADGEPFHIGELVDEMLPFGGYAAPAPIDTMELSRGASGYVWMVKLDAENRALISPKLLRHHAPTVEDVLTEFAAKLIERGELTNGAAQTIAKYAKRLTLASNEEEQ